MPLATLDAGVRSGVIDALTATGLMRLRSADNAREPSELLITVETRLVEESETLYVLAAIGPAKAGASPSFAANGAINIGHLAPGEIMTRARTLASELGARVAQQFQTQLGPWLKASLGGSTAAPTSPLTFPKLQVIVPPSKSATKPLEV